MYSKGAICLSRLLFKMGLFTVQANSYTSSGLSESVIWIMTIGAVCVRFFKVIYPNKLTFVIYGVINYAEIYGLIVNDFMTRTITDTNLEIVYLYCCLYLTACHCQIRNSPGFNPCMLRHSET